MVGVLCDTPTYSLTQGFIRFESGGGTYQLNYARYSNGYIR